jgi:hypothetical protein
MIEHDDEKGSKVERWYPHSGLNVYIIYIYICVMKHGRRFMTIRPTVEMQASWVNKTLMNGLMTISQYWYPTSWPWHIWECQICWGYFQSSIISRDFTINPMELSWV